MLEIKNLKASIGGKGILKGLNLSIKPGEVHAIMGPNGSGKSTLANVLSGKNGYKISGELKYKGNYCSNPFTDLANLLTVKDKKPQLLPISKTEVFFLL